MTVLAVSAVVAYLGSAAAFAPTNRRGRFGASILVSSVNEKNNNDSNAIPVGVTLSEHHRVSSALQHELPVLALLKSEESWKEWHYSFSRNGLTDFLPQFSDHIKCCMIGNDTTETGTAREFEHGRLPWQVNSEATTCITNLLGSINIENENDSCTGSDGSEDTASGLTHDHDRLGQIVSSAAASITNVDEKGFDCILDGGILNAVVSTLPSTVTWHSRNGPAALIELHSLMQEANKAIREFGIYVAITSESVPSYAKEYLSAMGEIVGLEWTFDLDGLSNEDYCVSVARKYQVSPVNLGGHYMPSPFSENDDEHLLMP